MKKLVLALVCASLAAPAGAELVVLVRTDAGGIIVSQDEPPGRPFEEAGRRGGSWKVLFSTKTCGHWAVWRASVGSHTEYFAASAMPSLESARTAASTPAFAYRKQQGRGGVVQDVTGGRYDKCMSGAASTGSRGTAQPGPGVAPTPGGISMRPAGKEPNLPGYDPGKHSVQLQHSPFGDFPAPLNVATLLKPGVLPGSDGGAAGLPGSDLPASARAEVCLPDRPGYSSAWRGECANAKPPSKPPKPPVIVKAPTKQKPPKKKTPKPTPTPPPKYAAACSTLDSLGNAHRPIVTVTRPEIYVTMSPNTLLYLRNLDTGETYKLGSTDKAIPPGRYLVGLFGVANAASPFTEKISACLNYRV